MTAPIIKQFADWVKTKPADERYDYEACDACALCQFLEWAGMAKSPRVIPGYWRDFAADMVRGDCTYHPFPDSLEEALVSSPHTFGALALRLDTAAKTGAAS